MCSKESDQNQAITSLQRDLMNGPLHCFGQHQRCSPDLHSISSSVCPPVYKDDDDDEPSDDLDVPEVDEDSSILSKYNHYKKI